MNPLDRKNIYDYLRECGFMLSNEQHEALKKLLQSAVPDTTVVYDESKYLSQPGDKDYEEE